MARVAIIIPARFASTRFPGKPLALLTGADGNVRPLIDWTWETAMRVPNIAEVVIATDDARIAEHARTQGMEVVMTPEHCLNGTERCAAALPYLATRHDIVVNLQGDAPLTQPTMVTAVIDKLCADPEALMATAAVPASPTMLRHLQDDARNGRVGGTTLVCNARGRALYFSKSIIPHVPVGTDPEQPVLLHVGLYAYRPSALVDYVALGPSLLERQEGLEQLRFLESDIAPGVAICPAPPWDLIELNNPTDRPLIEAQLRRRAQQEQN